MNIRETKDYRDNGKLGKVNIVLPIKMGRGGQSKERKKLYLDSLRAMADNMIEIQSKLDFHMGARDWCYAMEPYGLNKGNFDWAETQIKKARLKGFLLPGFILEEAGHEVAIHSDNDWTAEEWEGSEYQDYQDAEETYKTCSESFSSVSFWEDQDYYIQVLVEKAGLKSMLQKVCDKYHINIANQKGFGSMEQKATMSMKFKEMEREGKVPVLFAFGDFDPAGLVISLVTKKNFIDYSLFTGWNPKNLIVERIGLNYNFIQENNLSWVDGLETGSGRDMANPKHPSYKTYKVEEYIKKYGARKCESNAVVIVPELGRKLLIDAIHKYIGADCYQKFGEKILDRRQEIEDLITKRDMGLI